MALILGVRAGKDFFVGEDRIKVMKILSDKRFTVQTGQPGTLTVVEVSDEESVEVLPGVRLSAGLHGNMDLARVVIGAPKTSKILRGHIYRKEHQNV